jgi:energy-coupling factor transport system substrate-specific component
MASKPKLDLRHLVIFAMLGTLLYLSKWVLEGVPNVEMISTLTMVYTLVYRRQALIPIFLFILLEGIYPAAFGLWWYPYLYLWPLLWGITMLLPKRMPVKVQVPVYCLVCGLFGLAYGALYAPYQSLVFLGGDLKKTLAWIAAGFFPWDLIHAAGNLALGVLIVPLTTLLRRLEARIYTQ